MASENLLPHWMLGVIEDSRVKPCGVVVCVTGGGGGGGGGGGLIGVGGGGGVKVPSCSSKIQKAAIQNSAG